MMLRFSRCTRVCASVLLAACAATASAQCGEVWLPGSTAENGFNGSVESLLPWDADGGGPLPPVLLVGGSFTMRGATPMPGRLAVWDGADWQAFSPGPGFQPTELTVYRGKLIAAGPFNPSGGAMASLAQWDGAAWRPLSDGVNAQVRALAVHNDRLYVGGEMSAAGAQPVSRIAAWNGDAWSDVGGGVSGGMVLAMTSHADGLVVAGMFSSVAGGSVPASNIAVWDGSAWHAMGAGRPQAVESVHVYNNEVVAAGGSIAVWRLGSWQPLGQGPNQTVRALTTYRGSLVAGGFFSTAGGTSANRIARWDGQAWAPKGAGLEGMFGSAHVNTLTVFQDQLMVGGFFSTAGGQPSLNFARWEGACPSACDSIDFNGDALFPDTVDIADFLAVFSGGVCSGQLPTDPPCNTDIDFNNDGLLPDVADIDALLRVFAGGAC